MPTLFSLFAASPFAFPSPHALLPPFLPPLCAALQPRPLFDGVLTRVISCELQYGPMNCDFVWRGTNHPLFDEVTLPPVRVVGWWLAVLR
jgi:hypothetical protein